MIQNRKLKEFLSVLTNKNSEDITVGEIQNVESVRISTADINGEYNENFNDLKIFNNLNRIIIVDSIVTKDEIAILFSISTLKIVEFEHCIFENDMLISLLRNIQSLTFNNCLIQDYSFLKELNQLIELQVINPYGETILDLYLLNKKRRLKKIVLEHCNLTGFSFFGSQSLEEISLLNTSVDNLHFINKCPNLSTMFISERYINDPIINANTGRIDFKTNYMEFAFEEPTFK